MKKIRVFNYFGSKAMSAEKYPKPKYSTIIEPFAGGAGYSIFHWYCDVHLIDKDPNVIRAWQYLIKTAPGEIERLPLLAPGQLISSLPIEDDARVMMRWCAHSNGSANSELTEGYDKLSNWAEINLDNGGSGNFWSVARRARMAKVAHMVKGWTAIVDDYWMAPDIEATWFIDPPYQNISNTNYAYTKIDYERLAAWCRTRRGQVIVCEQAGATWLPFRELYSMRTIDADRGHRGRAREAVWTNG